DSACGAGVGKSEGIGNSRNGKNASAAEIDVASSPADISAKIEARPTECRRRRRFFRYGPTCRGTGGFPTRVTRVGGCYAQEASAGQCEQDPDALIPHGALRAG